MVATTNVPCDDAALDPIIKAHISTLYPAVDKRETIPFWASHFSEDAKLKKGATRIQGRDVIQAQVEKGWEALEARKHTVLGVFPFGKSRDEVMLHGRSENTHKSGEQTTFTWAARMHFKRLEAEGKVEIDEYTIIVDTEP